MIYETQFTPNLLLLFACLVVINFIYSDDIPSTGNSVKFQLKDSAITEGGRLIRESDCYSCHADFVVMTAPSYIQISERYRTDKNAVSQLANKIINGSKGAWDDVPMPPHPGLLREEAEKMSKYILHLTRKN